MQISRPTRGFSFGPFELDSDTGELRNNNTPVRLQPQPLQVLTILLQCAGKLVTREELQQRLWPEETFVEFEVGLNQAIKKLREALGDSPHSPTYIETIPRRGYRFIAPVEVSCPENGQDSIIGQVLGHYRLVERIGQGGMGVVYRAHDEHLKRDVAIKVLPQGSLADEISRQRFRKEALALSRLNHSNIASIFDFDTQSGMDFLVQELIPGTSLGQMLISGPLTEKQVVNLGSQICEGLAAAHGQGVIHRDIKPANLRVTPDGHLKILDFGLATVLYTAHPGGEKDPTASVVSVVEAQSTSGTLPYMAPEQLLNENLDARTDIWATGCVLYEMATGKLPFEAAGLALADAILHQPAPQPSRVNPKIAPGLEAIILKCLAKDPAMRYASAGDVGVDLHRLSTGVTTRALILRKRTLAAQWGLGLFAAILFVASAVGFRWYLKHHVPQFAHQPVAVVQFRNLTQDPQYEWLSSGMPEMLTTNLGQVTGIDVLSPERLATAEKRLKKKNPSTSPTPTEIAEEAGAKLFVVGSVMKVTQAKLVVEIRMQEVSTGKVIFTERMEGENIGSIFPMTNSTTDRLSKFLLPRNELPEKTAAVEQVTTSNIEAYRHYQVGNDYNRHFLMEKAVREYEEAVRLDPQFALAYGGLYWAYAALGNGAKRQEALHKLEDLQSRLPRLQQLSFKAIRSAEAWDLDSVRQLRETILREAPRNAGNRLRLAQALSGFEDDRAVALIREGIALDPRAIGLTSQLPYFEAAAGHEAAALQACDGYQALVGANEPNVWDTRADVLYMFGRDEEAAAALRRAIELDSSWAINNPKMAVIYADAGKTVLAREELRRYRQQATGIYLTDLPVVEAKTSQMMGNPEEALAMYQSVISPLARAGQTEMASETLWTYAGLSWLLGQELAALNYARRQQLQGREQGAVSLLEAAAGNELGSESALRQFAKTNPETASPYFFQRINAAVIALRHGNRDAALRVLQSMKKVEWDFDRFARARIYLFLNDYVASERDFRDTIRYTRVLGSYAPQRARLPLVEHLCHFYLGQVYEATGKHDDAIREYRSFLSRYINSRSRLPQITEARAAVKRLETHSNR